MWPWGKKTPETFMEYLDKKMKNKKRIALDTKYGGEALAYSTIDPLTLDVTICSFRTESYDKLFDPSVVFPKLMNKSTNSSVKMSTEEYRQAFTKLYPSVKLILNIRYINRATLDPEHECMPIFYKIDSDYIGHLFLTDKMEFVEVKNDNYRIIDIQDCKNPYQSIEAIPVPTNKASPEQVPVPVTPEPTNSSPVNRNEAVKEFIEPVNQNKEAKEVIIEQVPAKETRGGRRRLKSKSKTNAMTNARTKAKTKANARPRRSTVARTVRKSLRRKGTRKSNTAFENGRFRRGKA